MTDSKPNGHADVRDLGEAILNAGPERTLVKPSPVSPGAWAWLKSYGPSLAVVAALGLNLFMTGRWTGQIEKAQELTTKDVGEVKATVNATGDDFRKLTLDRVEDARQQSYIRAQNEILNAKLSAIEAILRERKQ